MKKIALPLLLILLITDCKKKPDDPATSSYDTENYFVIDGKTIYLSKGATNGISCNNQTYGWTELGGIGGNMLVISNIPANGLALIVVKYFFNGVVTEYDSDTGTKIIPTKVVNGKTVVEFSNLKFHELFDPTITKTISGKVTCP